MNKEELETREDKHRVQKIVKALEHRLSTLRARPIGTKLSRPRLPSRLYDVAGPRKEGQTKNVEQSHLYRLIE